MFRLLSFLLLAGVISTTMARANDILRVAVHELPPTFGNPFLANGVPSSFVWLGIFDALTRLDSDGVLKPGLATSWELVDSNTWRFNLRQGVIFSNGEPFNASAVLNTIEWLVTPEGRRSIIGNEMRSIAGVEAEDDYTVLIKTDPPDAILPSRLNAVFMVAPKAWQELSPDGFAKTPVGTGAFSVSDWGETSGTVIMDAHKTSWRAPKLDRIRMTNLPDRASRVQALLSGQVDIAGNMDIDDVAFLQGEGFQTHAYPNFGVMSIAFRLEDSRDGPLKDVRVRRAVNYGVNKQAIADALMLGTTVPGGQPAGRLTFGYNPDIAPYPYDPDKARALLKEAGYENGLKLTFALMVNRLPGDSNIYQTLADQLSQIGVDVELRPVTFPSWISNYLPGTWGDDIDGFTLSWNALPYNDVIRPMEYYSCLKTIPFYCDEGLTAQVVAAAGDMNSKSREMRLFDLAEEIHNRAPSLFLVEINEILAASPSVQGLRVANRVAVYEEITLSAE